MRFFWLLHKINVRIYNLMTKKLLLIPIPLFDSVEHLDFSKDFSYLKSGYQLRDIKIAIEFLKSYSGSQGTFNSYRREIERLLHWTALIAKTTLKQLKRNDIENFIKFCQKPPKEWIGKTKPPRFIVKDGERLSYREAVLFNTDTRKLFYFPYHIFCSTSQCNL